MGFSLQSIVVFFALAATFSLTFANIVQQTKVVVIQGNFYCSSDGNKQSFSTRGLNGASISLSCDGGVTILYQTTTNILGQFLMQIQDQAIVNTIVGNATVCAVYVRLPVAGCLLAPSNGFFQAFLPPNNIPAGLIAFFNILNSVFVSCL